MSKDVFPQAMSSNAGIEVPINMKLWRMAKSAPWLTGIGAFGAAPWFLNEHRPAAEYCSVQCVDLHDIAGIII